MEKAKETKYIGRTFGSPEEWIASQDAMIRTSSIVAVDYGYDPEWCGWNITMSLKGGHDYEEDFDNEDEFLERLNEILSDIGCGKVVRVQI